MHKAPCFALGPSYQPVYFCQECLTPSRRLADTPREVTASETLDRWPVCQACYRVHTYMQLSWGAPQRGPVARAQVLKGCLFRTDDRLGVSRIWSVCEGCGHCDEVTVNKAEQFHQTPLCDVCQEEMADDVGEARSQGLL